MWSDVVVVFIAGASYSHPDHSWLREHAEQIQHCDVLVVDKQLMLDAIVAAQMASLLASYVICFCVCRFLFSCYCLSSLAQLSPSTVLSPFMVHL